jgi:hypothetical protein
MADRVDGNDGKVTPMTRGKLSIAELFRDKPAGGAPPKRYPSPGELADGHFTAMERPAELEPPDGFDILPTPGDPYKAHSRPSSKPEPTLHVLLADGTVKGFAFNTFDSIDLLPAAAPGGGPVIVVRFAGIIARQVLITGRNLGLLHAYIAQHRIAWLRELPTQRGFGDTSEAVINNITVNAVEGFY